MNTRWMLLAALASALPGCKQGPPPEPSEPPARRSPLDEVPPSDSTLSLLEPRDGQCEWARVDPLSHQRAVVASFEGSCTGARLAWNADQSRALVWFDPSAVRSPGYTSEDASPPGYPTEQPATRDSHRLHEVHLATGQTRRLGMPPSSGRAVELGYGPRGPVALYLQSLTAAQRAQGTVTVDGQQLQLDTRSEGVPAIASAFELGPDDAWKKVEMKATTENAPYAPGVRALEASRRVGVRSDELLEPRFREGHPVSADRADEFIAFLPAPLAARPEGPPQKGWVRGRTSAGNFYLWQVTTDFTWSTGRLVFEGEGGRLLPVPEPGFTDGDLVAVRTQGPFLLVSSQRVGTHPRLYDLRTRQLVFRSDEARAATFWPRPPSSRAGAGAP